MYYAERWVDGWLWWRPTPDGSWLCASQERMIERLREALRTVSNVSLFPDHKRDDAEFLRGSMMAARGAALTALGQ